MRPSCGALLVSPVMMGTVVDRALTSFALGPARKTESRYRAQPHRPRVSPSVLRTGDKEPSLKKARKLVRQDFSRWRRWIVRQHSQSALAILGEDKFNESGVSACGWGLVKAGWLYSVARPVSWACGPYGHTRPTFTSTLSFASRSAVSVLKSTICLPLNLRVGKRCLARQQGMSVSGDVRKKGRSFRS